MLKENEKTKTQIDNDILLNTYLNYHLFNNDFKDSSLYREEDVWNNYSINLIIRPQCTQSCEYCYIYQHGKELYPLEERYPNEVLIHNFKILVDYLMNRKCYLRFWELYAGDLFYDNLFFDLMDVLYPYYKTLREEHPELYKDNIPVEIITPLNISIMYNDDKVSKLEAYIDKFKAIDVTLGFSFSTDGKYAEASREKMDVPEEIYEKLFSLASRRGFGFHPMVSGYCIEDACKNYDWWIEQLEKYPIHDGKAWCPSYLEVRNPDMWTDEKIQYYLLFLDHMIDHRLQKCNYNIDELAKNITNHPSVCPKVDNNDLLTLYIKDPYMENGITCGQQFTISITLNNLDIVPCHRLTYDHFKGGKFIVNENSTEIIGIEAYENLNSYLNINCRNIFYEPKCVACEINYMCIHGCLGAQYENSGEIFMPIDSVCKLLCAKFEFLIKRYHELGVLKLILEKNYLGDKDSVRRKILIRYLKEKGYEYE